MEEPDVKTSVEKYLLDKGWKVHSKIKPGFIYGIKFIPDIVADKEENLMAVECKGSVDLDDMINGIGQCVTYANYGANIICFAVPKDKEKIAIELIKNVNIHKKGKIGLFIVDEGHIAELKISWTAFELPSEYQKIKKFVLQKLAYVVDIKLNDIGKILNFAYKNRGNYERSKELVRLLEQNKRIVFRDKKLTHRMLTNFLITFNHLHLWDRNYVLNEEGCRLRLLYKSKKRSEFKNRVAYLLLTEGNWLGLLSIMEELSNKNFKNKMNYNKDLVKYLISNNYYPPSEKIEGLAKKMGDRFYRFLKDFDFIDEKGNKYIVNWKKVVLVLRKY